MAERWCGCCSLKYRNICLAGLLFSWKFGWKQELFVHLQICHNPCVLCIVYSFFREQQGQTHCLWAAAWTELLACGLAGPSSLCSSKVLAFTHWKETHAITSGDSRHLENPVYMHWEHLHKWGLSPRWSCPEDGLLWSNMLLTYSRWGYWLPGTWLTSLVSSLSCRQWTLKILK